MEQTQPFLVLDRLPRQMIVFGRKEDAADFLNREMQLWTWIDTSEHPYNQIRNVQDRYRLDNWAQHFRNLLDANSSADFEQFMRQRYVVEQCLCSIDIEARALQTIGTTDGTVGLVTLAALHGEVPYQDPKFNRDLRNRTGVAHAHALLAGLNPSAVSGAHQALKEAREEFELDTQRVKALFSDTRAEATAATEQIKAEAQALGLIHQESFSTAERSRAETFQKLRDDLDATQKAFEVRMELQAPVAYWKKRADQYKAASRLTLAFLIIFGSAAIYILHRLYESAATHLPTESASTPYAALFRASAFALLMTSIIFWVGRILLRVYLSTRHLSTDAEERRTMITTFLALTRRSAVSEDDRKFILAALFRPGSDGIVSEDAAPDTAFAALIGTILKK